MKAIIFGIGGQDGYYLRELLNADNITVIGVSRKNGDWLRGNISDICFVEELVKREQPNYIFHLAANSSVKHEYLLENYATITTGSINVLESVYKYSPKTKVFLSGSALQFKNHGLPIKADDSFEGRDPYSVARIQSVYMARYYKALGLQVYVGYFFHHDSPLRSERHLNMQIINAVKKVRLGKAEILELGNLDVIKEYNYAADMMSAIWALVNQEVIFESTIGCGTGYSIKDWLKICFEKIGAEWQDHIRKKDGYQPDFKILVSDPSVISSLGWKPKTDIYGLADILLAD